MKHCKLLVFLILCRQCVGFSSTRHPTTPLQKSSLYMNPSLPDNMQKQTVSRRHVTKTIGTILTTGLIPLLSNPTPTTAEEATIWKTGKSPEVPGQKPKDKSDTKGTRKDPNFLRSIADCKGKCENSPGPDGLARSSSECLSACQDICCTTYEQCTFAIVAR